MSMNISLVYELSEKQSPPLCLEIRQSILIEEDIKLGPVQDLRDKLEEMEKPWLSPGVDVKDYFNYGLNEQTFQMHQEKLRLLRIFSEFLSRKKDGEKSKRVKIDPNFKDNIHSQYSNTTQYGINRYNSYEPQRERGRYNEPQNERGRYSEPQRERGRYNESQNERGRYSERQDATGRYNEPQRERGRYNESQNERGRYSERQDATGRYNEPQRERGRYNESQNERGRYSERQDATGRYNDLQRERGQYEKTNYFKIKESPDRYSQVNKYVNKQERHPHHKSLEREYKKPLTNHDRPLYTQRYDDEKKNLDYNPQTNNYKEKRDLEYLHKDKTGKEKEGEEKHKVVKK